MSSTSNDTPAMTFETFLLSLGTAAMVALGEIENPMTGKKEPNLGAAKQHIDILEILSQKTMNNLSAQEKKLIEDILYQTRLKYVAFSTKK